MKCALALASLLCASCATTPRYVVTQYPDFGRPTLTAVGITHGQVVVDSIEDGRKRPALWADPHTKRLLPLPASAPRTYFQPRAVNEEYVVSDAVASTSRDGYLAVWSDLGQPPQLVPLLHYSLIRPIDVCGQQVVGYANPTPYTDAKPIRAFLYINNSFVTLDPPNGEPATVYATDGARQFGSITYAGRAHPVMWNSSPDHPVDFLPPGKTSGAIRAARANLQAGAVDGHAALWAGNPASFRDLHPQGFLRSAATATDGRRIVGFAALPGPGPQGTTHAFLWIHRRPFDLHALLPARFTASSATFIDPEGRILGTATADGQSIAVVWTPAKLAHRPPAASR
jgi:hypothetical protein